MNRVGDFIVTYTGKRFYPCDPDPEEVDIEDVAHALSMINRFTGHTKFPYSVAQHSVYAYQRAKLYSRREALLHDAPEAYLNDISRPLKKSLPDYRRIEAGVGFVCSVAFSCSFPMSDEVRLIDNKLLVTEAPQLIPASEPWYQEPHWPTPYELEIEEWPWRQAKQSFLDAWEECCGKGGGPDLKCQGMTL